MSPEAVVADTAVRRRGLTREQYEVLVGSGVMDDVPVELLEGVLVDVVPQGEPQVRTVRRLYRWLVPRVEQPWWVSVQMPLAATDDSEPEPDVSIVQEPASGHPRTAALVVEVARSSHRVDLVHKPRVYAAADVEQYWVVDLLTREVVVHTGPSRDGYADVQRLPWTTELSVLGVPVDLASLLADL